VSEPLKIQIWSDIACPWCYIGKRMFEAGSDLFSAAGGGRGVEVEYRSFELSPDTPVDFDGSEADFLAGHKGIPAAQVQQMLERVTGVAASVGLDYDFDALKHTNTVRAHELLHFGKAQGKQRELVERLFRAYFVEGRHVGRAEDLATLAAEVGLDRAAALAALESSEFREAVRVDQAVAREYGITGVPFFVIDGKYGVSGAQGTAAFAQALEQAWTERTAATA